MYEQDWDDLAYVLAVARTGSLSAASRTLGVHTATVGRRVSRLEASLQATLFERTPSGLTLTAAGYRVVESAERVEAEIREVRAATLARDRRVSGLVRLATAPLLARYLLAPAMPALCERHPELSVQFVTRRERESLATGALDLAYRLVVEGQDPATPGMLARRVGGTEFRVFASRDYLERHPVARPVTTLRGHRRIGYSEVPDPGARWYAELEDPGSPVAVVNQMPVAHALAEQGIGVATLLAFMPGPDSPLEPISPPTGRASMVVVMPASHRDIARVRAVADWLAELTAAL